MCQVFIICIFCYNVFMKKFFTIFFVALGVIFFIILLILAYLFIFDPYNLKPFITGSNTPAKSIQTKSDATSQTSEVNTNTESSNLSPTQARALEVVDIDPNTLPQSFTTEQLKCFETILGKTRVEEIKAGATPSFAEFNQAKSCI